MDHGPTTDAKRLKLVWIPVAESLDDFHVFCELENAVEMFDVNQRFACHRWKDSSAHRHQFLRKIFRSGRCVRVHDELERSLGILVGYGFLGVDLGDLGFGQLFDLS